MTKEQYLNYLMLTEPNHKWALSMYMYMDNNGIRNWKKGFDFIIQWALSGYTGSKLAYHPCVYAYYMIRHGSIEIEWAMKVIEDDETKNYENERVVSFKNSDEYPAIWAAKGLFINGHVSEEWYEKILNKKRASDD